MHAPLLALEVVGALAVDLDIDRDQLHLRTGIDRVGRTPVRRLAFELGIDERVVVPEWPQRLAQLRTRSEEHTSELQSLMRISYAVFCLKKKNTIIITTIVSAKRT